MARIKINIEGHLVDAYDVVDPTVPYVRPFRDRMTKREQGPWAGLDPDVVHDGAVEARSGYIRGRLHDIAVRKNIWEGASAKERDVAARAIDACFQIEDAVRTMLSAHDPELRTLCRDFLERLVDGVDHERRHPGGWRRLDRKLRQRGLDVHWRSALVAVLQRIKESDTAKRSQAGAKWIADRVIEVNAALARAAVRPLPAVCKVEDIEFLIRRGNSAAKTADKLLRRADPDMPLDDMRRRAPRRRQRRAKKAVGGQ